MEIKILCSSDRKGVSKSQSCEKAKKKCASVFQSVFRGILDFHDNSPRVSQKTIEMSSDSSLQTIYKTPLAKFWCSLRIEYPQLTQKADLILLRFATTYLYEPGFST